MKIFKGALSICFYKEAHPGGPYISRFSDQQVTSIKIAVASKEGQSMKLLSNMNEFLPKHSKIFQGALSICFDKEVHSGGHYISHFFDKQVISVKIPFSPKVSFGIRLLSNMNRILMRAF